MLEELGTEYVQLWSTFLYQGAHTPKQEGRGCVKRGWNSPKASAFLHILLSIPNHNYNEESRIVLVWTRNWVCAFLEHFLLPRCTCLFLVGMAGDQRSGFLQCCCFLHILISIRNHNYNEKLRRVLVSTWNWLCAALEHFPWPRCTCLFLVVWQVIRGVHSFSAAAFLHILLSIPNHNFDDEESRSVLGISRNWVCAFLEHFPLPRCTCLTPEVWQVIRELWIPSVLLLSWTYCSAFLIVIIIRSPEVCLEYLVTEYVHF